VSELSPTVHGMQDADYAKRGENRTAHFYFHGDDRMTVTRAIFFAHHFRIRLLYCLYYLFEIIMAMYLADDYGYLA
jgi:hypothetical protein